MGLLQNTPPEYVEVPVEASSYPGEEDSAKAGGKADDYRNITRYDFSKKDFYFDLKLVLKSFKE
ncbi:MAG: hypothetical protein ACI4LX_05825 [Treponema sp.]